MVHYITKPYTASTGNATITEGSATVTSSAAFGSLGVGDLICFNYGTAGQEYKGWWAIIQTWTSSSSITMDRTAPSDYWPSASSGAVAWKWVDTLDKYNLDTINSMRFSVQSSAQIYGMPGQTTRSALFFDDGATRTITVNGTFTGTAAAVATYLNDISELQDGDQYASNPLLLCVPHLSWWAGNGAFYLVAIKSFDWSYIKPDGTMASYTLQCVERQ